MGKNLDESSVYYTTIIDTLYGPICIVTMETDGRDVTALYR